MLTYGLNYGTFSQFILNLIKYDDYNNKHWHCTNNIGITFANNIGIKLFFFKF